jgi:murein L,D-transpeptidase YafK
MLEKIESFLPKEEKELLESTVQNETEALGVAQAKEIISPVRTEETKIISLVESWRSAWESKSLNEYIACYHPGFQNKGKDLNAWKHYKEKLNDRYRYISVNVWELKVKVEGRMGWAYFRQRYRSDSLLSYGYKLIEFRKEGDS